MTVGRGASARKPGELPAGAVARGLTVTAKVVGVDRRSGAVTLELPSEERMTFKVEDPDRLDRMRVGDLVEATYREAIAVAVDKQ